MDRSEYSALHIRHRIYKKIFEDEDVLPVEIQGGNSIISPHARSDFLMHAHFMTLQMEELFKDGEHEMAFYLLGAIETILMQYGLLKKAKMFY